LDSTTQMANPRSHFQTQKHSFSRNHSKQNLRLINNLKRPKWNIYDVEYTNQTSSLIKQKDSGTLKITSSTTYPPGSIYELPAGVLHRSTLRSEFAITALATTINSSNSQKPRVIGNLSDNNLIFSRSISNPQNIRQIIHNSIEYLEGLKVSA